MPTTKRSRTITEIRSLARSHTRTALNVLVGVMRSTKAPAPARIAAANAILDRGWGKAAQAVEGHDGSALNSSIASSASLSILKMSILKIPTAKIFEPLLSPARYKGIYGGRGSGKSHFFGELLVETCQAERGTLAVCIREAQRTLAQSSKRLIEAKIASLRPRPRLQGLQRQDRNAR